MTVSVEEIEFLDGQTHKNMAIIPLKTPLNYKLDVITLKKGFELGLVNVKECEESTVNTLVVENMSVTPLLLIDGDEIIGGDQNRIVNGTILIAPKSEMKIPVNCTEHGRWGYKHEFKNSNFMATSRTRCASISANRSSASVQNAVWDSIDALETEHGFHSPTQAMSESYENLNANLDEVISKFKTEKGQTGVVVIVDGEIKGFELFINSDVYSQYHEKILKSYLIDIDINDSVFTINMDTAKAIIANAIESELVEAKNVGLEKRFEIQSEDGIGTVYIHNDELIHCSFFTKAGETPEPVDSDWISERIAF